MLSDLDKDNHSVPAVFVAPDSNWERPLPDKSHHCQQHYLEARGFPEFRHKLAIQGILPD
jgi:hypothetical protein